MDVARLRLPARVVFAACVVLGYASQAAADPYYQIEPANFPFPTSHVDWTFTEAQLEALPGVEGISGASNPEPRFFPMTPLGENVLGTLIGGVPSGASRALPYSTLTLGYTQLQPDGQYGTFVPITSNPYAEISLNSQNQILVRNFDSSFDSEIINLNTGTTTLLSKIVPPGFNFSPWFIADNGAIEGDRYDSATMQDSIVILAPPGLVSPSPVPEPGTVVIFGLAFAGLAYARRSTRSPRD